MGCIRYVYIRLHGELKGGVYLHLSNSPLKKKTLITKVGKAAMSAKNGKRKKKKNPQKLPTSQKKRDSSDLTPPTLQQNSKMQQTKSAPHHTTRKYRIHRTIPTETLPIN